MTKFVRGRPVKTSEARVAVDPGLAVGTHRFQLVIVTDDGRKSAPDVVDLAVLSRVVIRPPRKSVTEGVSSLITPAVTPIRVPARPRASKPRKSAKTRSET